MKGILFLFLGIIGLFLVSGCIEGGDYKYTYSWECVEWNTTIEYYVEIIGEPVGCIIYCDNPLPIIGCIPRDTYYYCNRTDEGLKDEYNITIDMIKNRTIKTCTKEIYVRELSEVKR